MSDTTNSLLSRVRELEANKPGGYTSQYGDKISALMDKINNREPFSYDFNADPLYRNYKDQYTKLGKEASMNAVANASNMTGGYANSYAATAGAQANQQYLTQLNNIIPELYNAALNKYDNDTNSMYNKLGMYTDAENSAYQKYRDTVSDYYSDLGYAQDAYNNSVANDQWQANFDESKRQFDLNYALSRAQAASGGGSSSSKKSGSYANAPKSGYDYSDFAIAYMNAAKYSGDAANNMLRQAIERGFISESDAQTLIQQINTVYAGK